jgi:hypothetical protein
MSRLPWSARSLVWCARIALFALSGLLVGAPRSTSAIEVAEGLRVEVVAVDIPRPTQLALDAQGRLVVLSLGARGDAAAEIYRIDPAQPIPVDGTRLPHVVVPFAQDSRKTVFGSLAVDPRTGDLFLGEENGNRIYRLGVDHRLQAVAIGLDHLLGGSALTLDRHGRLVFLDYASPETHRRSEMPVPPSLSGLIEDGYQGPLVYRIDLREERPLPRRADLLAPIFPRGAAPPAGIEPLWRFIGVAEMGDDLVFLTSVGEVFRLGADGVLHLLTRLPGGHYHRTNLTPHPDGSVLVCGGFQIRQIFRIFPGGQVTTIASELGDPGGIVVDREGTLYVPETALHRIIRIVPARPR